MDLAYGNMLDRKLQQSAAMTPKVAEVFQNLSKRKYEISDFNLGV